MDDYQRKQRDLNALRQTLTAQQEVLNKRQGELDKVQDEQAKCLKKCLAFQLRKPNRNWLNLSAMRLHPKP